jgi:transposase-like protein
MGKIKMTKYTPEERLRLYNSIMEKVGAGAQLVQSCRDFGVNPGTFGNWKRYFKNEKMRNKVFRAPKAVVVAKPEAQSDRVFVAYGSAAAVVAAISGFTEMTK